MAAPRSMGPAVFPGSPPTHNPHKFVSTQRERKLSLLSLVPKCQRNTSKLTQTRATKNASKTSVYPQLNQQTTQTNPICQPNTERRPNPICQPNTRQQLTLHSHSVPGTVEHHPVFVYGPELAVLPLPQKTSLVKQRAAPPMPVYNSVVFQHLNSRLHVEHRRPSAGDAFTQTRTILWIGLAQTRAGLSWPGIRRKEIGRSGTRQERSEMFVGHARCTTCQSFAGCPQIAPKLVQLES